MQEQGKPKITIRWYIESGRSSPSEATLCYMAVREDGTTRSEGGINLRSAITKPSWVRDDDNSYWPEYPAVTQESALEDLCKQYEELGWEVRFEKGHYRKVWEAE